MTVIICVDDNNGVLFNNRRLSRDSSLYDHILDHCDGNLLWMNAYSASIFPRNASNIRISEKFLDEMGEDACCFVENSDILEAISKASTLILYRWNRTYPSDVKLPGDFLSGKKLVSTVDFAGNSHPFITQEVYEI